MVFLSGAQWAKNLPAMKETQEMQAQSLGWEDPLEEAMATRSSILASKIPQTEESGWLQFTGFKGSDTTGRLSTWAHVVFLL